MKFSKDFIFGTATASYQVEGALDKDNRLECIWDVFSRTDKVYKNHNGNIAADQYNKYKEDVKLMSDLNLNAYRFSISWPRVMKEDGTLNKKGMNYYINLLKELKKYNIKAAVTLYHWDLPQYLQDKGGWANVEIVNDFIKYSELCFKHLDNLVDYWITINEPFCIAYLGHLYAVHAPGLSDIDITAKTIHHLNLAHAKTVLKYKEKYKKPIGITLNLQSPRPVSKKEEDINATNRARAFGSDVFLMPALGKDYPDIKELKFPIQKDDLNIIKKAGDLCDFLGLNYYFENLIQYSNKGPEFFKEAPMWQDTTDMGWPIDSMGLYRQLKWVSSLTDKDLYITENGMANKDILENNRVHDKERINYLRDHLKACQLAIDEGVNLKGYYLWSFIDNYEWSFGYSKRFGIIYCDYEDNQKRYPKDSAYFIRDLLS